MSGDVFDHRWVASAGSAKSASRAFLRFSLRRRRLWSVVAVVALACFWMGWAGFGSWVAGLAYGVLSGGAVAAIALVIWYLQTRRYFATRLAPGTVIESRFEPGELVLRRPDFEGRYAYRGIASLRLIGDWVLLQHDAHPAVLVAARVLFPDPDLSQMRRLMAQR